jgi:hypothetical protein
MPRIKGNHPFHKLREFQSEEYTIEIPREASLRKMIKIVKKKFRKKIQESKLGPETKYTYTRLLYTSYYPKTIRLTYLREEPTSTTFVLGKEKGPKINVEDYSVTLPGGKVFV